MTTPTHSLEVRADVLEHTQRHWQQRSRAGDAATATAASIALTREAGTPGTSVAREVGARLGWQVYDHELLERISQESGLRLSLLESIDERQKNWLTESFEAFGAVPAVSESTYVRHLVQAVLSLGALGHCVIVGRGAAFILPGDRTLRVRLVGELQDRIEGAARRQGLTRQAAARWVEEKERERTRFVRDHFLKDSADPNHYDLVLNTSRWSVADCADVIVEAVRRVEARLIRARAGTPLP
jgi:cytidylate kinase